MPSDLTPFAPWTRAWFRERFGEPTAAQARGWPPIIAGENVLLLAPTGSGKTLAAFLWGIDRIYRDLGEGSSSDAVQLLYISPLKALSNDIERNLREPLAGVRAVAARSGEDLPPLRTAVRTGDTPSSARVRMARQPPHLLITTPESLYLMLTSPHARRLFGGLRTVIVDEIHSLAGNKRGVHLALSLERLEHVAGVSPQRVGLSATQRPLEEVAAFLGGQHWVGEDTSRRLEPRPVTVVDAGREKSLDVQVITVVPDFAELGGDSIWPAVVERVVELVRAHRTTLVFANSRRLAERFAERLNEHLGPGVVRAHHGSISREVRHDLEQALKEGRLPALVATSSLELGIDIGSVDLVVQLQSPKGVTQGLQRIGRSGHLVGQTSVGRVFATFPEDLMEGTVVARGVLQGEVEPVRTPRLCLDVLAQQIVAAVAAEESWDATALCHLFRQAYPYRELSWPLFRSVVEMLSGRYPAELFRQLRARISWDHINNRLIALPGSRRLAVTSGGTIPDRGTFSVYLADGKTKIGELDEEFVFEARPGDVFTLGTHTWRAERITEDRVIASDASSSLPRLPFWRGDYPWRSFSVGEALGRFRREVAARRDDPGAGEWLQRDYALDENSARNVLTYVRRQVEALGAISSDRTLIVELFHDVIGDPRLVVHSPFGGRVNGAWGLALASALREERGLEVECRADDDGILLRFPDAEADPPLDLLERLSFAEARERILRELPDSALFGAQFRQNAARALLLPGLAGRRTPFWLQRLRARDLLAIARGLEDFPILAETVRDCLHDVFDMEHLEEVLRGIQEGRIEVVRAETILPSPLARGLLADFVGTYMYSWDAPKAERQLSALALSREMLDEVLAQPTGLSELLRPEALEELEARLQQSAPGFRARSREELAEVLHQAGDLTTDEIHQRCEGDASAWLAELASDRRALQVEVAAAAGRELRWVLAEHAAAYSAGFAEPAQGEARAQILRRFLHSHGPVTIAGICKRYAFDERWVEEQLDEFVRNREVVRGRLSKGSAAVQWCDRENLGELHRRSLARLRREVQPVSLFTYADFLTRHQHLHPSHRLLGEPGLRRVLEQLRAFWLPAELWEREVLPSRVGDYAAGLLDGLCTAGEVVWVARSPLEQPAQTRLTFLWRGEGASLLPERAEAEADKLSPAGRQVLALLEQEGACFTSDLERAFGWTLARLQETLGELVRAGLVTNDSFQALRGLLSRRVRPLGAGSALQVELSHRLEREPAAIPPARDRREAQRRVSARLRLARLLAGRWSLARGGATWGREVPREQQIEAQARLLLLRYGIVTRHCLLREDPSWSWADLYQRLERMELRGQVRRGYFVQGLPGAQFALPEAVEALRVWRDAGDDEVMPLSAYDPANIFAPGIKDLPLAATGDPLPLARHLSSCLLLHRGRPCLVAEGTRVTTAEGTDDGLAARALRALLAHVAARRAPGRPGRFRVTHWNGSPVLDAPGRALLESTGFHRRARDMEWWGEK